MSTEALDSFSESIQNILLDVKENLPLIHCITNPISINDCANSILALGGRPIMAEHPLEVAEITKTAAGLCLNIGNITDARMESIGISASTASTNNIPYILDLVGITCSSLRYQFINDLLYKVKPTVIKGNLSEIKKFAQGHSSFVGVDSTESLDCQEKIDNASSMVKQLSLKTGSVIVASGEIDLVSDGTTTAAIYNGSPYLPMVTGTGCMQTVIIGTMISSKASSHFNSTVLGALITALAGELSEAMTLCDNCFSGLGTYHINLINGLSQITPDIIKKNQRVRFF